MYLLFLDVNEQSQMLSVEDAADVFWVTADRVQLTRFSGQRSAECHREPYQGRG